MATGVTSIRLPEKDAVLVEHFVNKGDFKSRSEFIRYAVKKTINEMILREFHERLSQPTDGKKVAKIQEDIKKIRKQLWDDYARHIS